MAALTMVMKSRSLFIRLNLIIVFLCINTVLFAASNSTSKWVLTAEKFSFVNKESDSVDLAVEKVLPTRILDNLGNSLYRNILYDEQYARDTLKLKSDRLSLFLQLSSETKKRDNLVLGNYSQKELKEKIQENEASIQNIKDKIDENLEKQKEYELRLQEYLNNSQTDQKDRKKNNQSEFEKYANLIKNLIKEDKTEIINEEISVLKRNDVATLYETKGYKDYLSSEFELEMNTNKINGFFTGKITSYAEYLFVTVDLYAYPGAKLLTTISEVGTLDELDFISENLARQMIPALTNSMPISIQIKVEPEEAIKTLKVYVDNNIIQNPFNVIDLDSGVHFLQFVSDGFRTAGTTYFFDGNKRYLVEVNLESSIQGTLFVEKEQEQENNPEIKTKFISLFTPPVTDSTGVFYSNGMETVSKNGKSSISINGERILGEFVAENGETSFFYIPENMAINNAVFSVKANALNRDDYIEMHRRKMYNAYSGLVVSLIPYFVTKGLTESNIDTGNKERATIWNYVNLASVAACIGCGGWFVFELVRYFMAADTVLPEKAKLVDNNSEEIDKKDSEETKKVQKK